MPRKKKVIPSDIGDGDYCIAEITVEKNPKAEFVLDELTGEISPRVAPRERPFYCTIPILISPEGFEVIPVNLFMRFLANNDLKLSSMYSYLRGILAFYRWLRMGDKEKTIYDCCDIKENGVVYGFRDFLLENVKTEVKAENGDIEIKGIYEPDTCKLYILTIVKYFEFLHVECIARISNDFVPFEYRFVRTSVNRRLNQHHVLGHLKKGDRRIVVSTTGLTKPFGKYQSTPAHHKLSPMNEEQKKVFYSKLDFVDGNYKTSSEVKNLMLYLATETGLRLEELVTFPETVVRFPGRNEEIITAPIGYLINGCKTKFDKQRTIEIPSKVMDELLLYMHCSARECAKKRSPVKHNALFVNPKTGLPFNPNTIQKHFSAIREVIRLSHPDWFFTVHDTRSTFATHWLYKQHLERNLIFEVLLDELKFLMGHEDSKETEKYIKYMNVDKYWLEFAAKKNKYMQNVME